VLYDQRQLFIVTTEDTYYLNAGKQLIIKGLRGEKAKLYFAVIIQVNSKI